MLSTVFAPLLAFTALAAAQTSTTCQPLTNTCPANSGLNEAVYTANFVNGADKRWQPVTGTIVSYTSQGAQLQVASAGQGPTMQTDFYIFFGYVEAKIKASPGVGLVSSLVLLSDDLDEIDWEWLGGRDGAVQTNYFGKGNTTTYDRATWANVNAATTTFHTYGIDWTPSAITWYIDGNAVRTLNYANAVGGRNFPQTPARVSVGVWAGGASSAQGTVDWAGGRTDFSQGPFNMYIESVTVKNYNPANSYTYGDNSGSYQSIKMNGGGAFNGAGSGTGAQTSNNGNSGSNAGSSSSVAPPPPTTTTTVAPPPPTTTTTVAPPPTTTTTLKPTTTTTIPTTTTTTPSSTTIRTTTTSTSTSTSISTSTTTATTSNSIRPSSSVAGQSTLAASSSAPPNAGASHLDMSWLPSLFVSTAGLFIGAALL